MEYLVPRKLNRLKVTRILRLVKLSMILLSFFCVTHLHAQVSGKQIKGQVINEKGQPLSGATVKQKGSDKNGTSTDPLGNFSLTVPGNTAVLTVSYIGYISLDVKLNAENSSLKIVLKEAAEGSADDVIVIGYQTVTRKKNTAAISSISGKEIENLPAASFDQLMQGRLSGVNVQSYSGAPGTSPTVAVRGN